MVLLNGRRQVTSGAQTDGGVAFVDTASLVPVIAISQIEILKNGAAALYGSDAVGGVANFRTRSNFEGFELDGEFRAVTDDHQTDVTIQAIWGHQGDRFRITASGSYFDRSALTARERNLRPQAAFDQLLSVSLQTGLPGTFLLPTAPLGNLNDTVAFLTLYDQVGPSFANPLAPLVPDTIPNPSPGVTLPPSLTAFGIFSNPAPPLFPFPTITGPLGIITPGSVFTGFVAPDAAAGEGVINIPAPVAAALGLGPNAIALGADGIADSLEGLVFPTVFALAAPGVAAALGVPESFLSFAAVPNALAPLPEFPDPSCQAAVGVIPDIVPLTETFVNPLSGETTQVGACGYDFNAPFDLVPEQTSGQAYTQWSFDVSDSIEFYGDFGLAINRSKRNNSNFPITTPIPIDAAYPFNTFRAPVLWLGRSPGIGQVQNGFQTLKTNPTTHESDTYRALVGLKGDLNETWSWDVAFTWGRNEFFLGSIDGVLSRLGLGLQGLGGPNCDAATGTPGVGGCEFYNVFGTGILADPSDRAPLLDPATLTPILDVGGNPITVPVLNSQSMLEWIVQPVTIDIISKMKVVDGLVTGEIMDLPAGPLGVALGVQYRSETLGYDYDDFTNAGDRTFVGQANDFLNNRDVISFFGELAIPVTTNFDLQLALRYEDYGGFVGDTLDPRVAGLWRITDNLVFRGSFGTSFRAPSVFQLFGNQTTLQSVDDKRPGAGAPFISILSQGNRDLKPEESTNWNAGFTVSFPQGFQASFDYWRIEFKDVIVQENAQDLADRALIGGEVGLIGTQVFLNPNTGALLSITANYINAAFIESDGIDFSFSQTWETETGIFRIGGEATYILSYDLPGVDGVRIKAADSRNDQNFADPVPDFRANANVSWSQGRHAATVYLRYIGSFLDDENTTFGTLAGGTRDFNNVIDAVKVKSFTTVDIQYSIDLSEMLPWSSTRITIGAINVFDKRPPFVFTDGSFETRTHDPRGRLAYLRFNGVF